MTEWAQDVSDCTGKGAHVDVLDRLLIRFLQECFEAAVGFGDLLSRWCLQDQSSLIPFLCNPTGRTRAVEHIMN